MNDRVYSSANYRSAAELEQDLGDPFSAGAVISFAEQVELDDAEAFPTDAWQALLQRGFQRHLVPEALGGSLRSFEELLALVRVVARRDVTLAVAFGTALLGTMPVWLWGTPAQQRRLADLVLAGAVGSFAMSERDHGSDILATECTARIEGAHYVLSGSKWPIGNPGRGAFATVLARLDDGGSSPAGHVLLLVVKDDLTPGSFEVLPPVKTLGLRGHELGGLAFRDCVVGGDALVGASGLGVDQTLKALRFTRTLIAGLSLGAADTGLRIATMWARERRLYGAPIAELGAVRTTLLDSWLDLRLADATAITAARTLQAAPHQASLSSAIAKYVVPVFGESILRDCAVVLGARHYMREGIAGGVFQKMQRDCAIASVFEGTTLVNLHAIGGQLGQLAAERSRRVGSDELDAIFRLDHELTCWTPSREALEFTSRGEDHVVHGLATTIDRLPPDLPDIRILANALVCERDALLSEVRQLPTARLRGHATGEGVVLARRYALLYVGAAALHLWAHNREQLGERFACGDWLNLALARVLGKLGRILDAPPAALVERVTSDLWRDVDEARMFSATAVPLSAAGGLDV